MKINEKNLLLFGFKKIANKKSLNTTYELMTSGYKFIVIYTHKKEYIFYVYNIGSENNYHCITHLDEVLGFIADDCIECGKKEKIEEVKEVLNFNN